jgi:hypothetical protein
MALAQADPHDTPNDTAGAGMILDGGLSSTGSATFAALATRAG